MTENQVEWFRKRDDSRPTAFIEVKIYGDASSDTYGKMTKELNKLHFIIKPESRVRKVSYICVY